MVHLENLLAKGVRLIQARLKRMHAEAVEQFLARAYPLCQRHGAWLLINSDVKRLDTGYTDGLHLTAHDLMACSQRPEPFSWVAASCHNQKNCRMPKKSALILLSYHPYKQHPPTPMPNL